MRAWRSEEGLQGQGEGREELVSGAGLELGGGNSGWHREKGGGDREGGRGGGGMVEMCRKSRWGGERLEWMCVRWELWWWWWWLRR